MGKREPVALLNLSSWCLVIVVWLFFVVPWVCLQFVIVVRDMFHVYLNRFDFHFLRLHIIKTNKFYFFIHNRRAPDIAK